MLIGSGPSLSMFCTGQIDLSRGGIDLIPQKTQLGWIVGGNIAFSSATNANSGSVKCHFSDLHSEIAQFWELEEGFGRVHLSTEAVACEKHFQEHTTRNSTGRYVVALPFRSNRELLGESRSMALKRLNTLERRFKHNSDLENQYSAIIKEYLKLNHMSLAKNEQEFGFYLPHHAIFKENSLSTKVRVVFDGSAKSDSGLSLNDTLMAGPTIQDDIFSHLLRFRLHNYVLTGDIEKMYRQFEIRKEDRKFQRILWRFDGVNVQTFELNTVTFGMSSSPFLAIRALRQLADDESHKHPNAAIIFKRDMYVDDLITGTETVEQGIRIRDDIIKLLKLGGLNIRQWASNEAQLLQGIPESSINQHLHFNNDQPLKTLGVSWSSVNDRIIYFANSSVTNSKISKRTMLSEIAKLFDPLGLLGPITLFAKILMKRLWEFKLDWDESVPNSIHKTWAEFRAELVLVNDLSFDRRTIIEGALDIQLHGFCDASEKGYGACMYIRSTNNRGHSESRLLCAKSRVAPLKTIPIARLELCGAQLLSKLYTTIDKSIQICISKTVFWTDSTIVVCWINTSPHRLETFIANRVSDIQEKTNPCDWRHIRSEDNPADALSRGQMPAKFIENNLWKLGTKWLKGEESAWPAIEIQSTKKMPGFKKELCLTISPEKEFFHKFSSYSKLKRIVAYCLRMKLRNHQKGILRVTELVNEERAIIRATQMSLFATEMNDMKNGKRVNKKSRIVSLDPFLDRDGIIRVGGRLENSTIPYCQQHPMLLPCSSHVTDLIIQDAHLRNEHAGIQTTLYALRQRFWPLDGRNQVRKVMRKCVKCFRANPRTAEYLMGNLPKVRTTKARPFCNVGVDYCGPFYIKEKKHRNRSRVKVYIALSICLAIKAVHLEVVTDMTTEGFLAALRRLVARRGKPNLIYSDNGSNFIGANNELKEIQKLLQSEAHNETISQFLSDQGIEWKFIPPLSPHFGGIWESTVKIFKHHFKRVVNDILFTFEEFNTFAIEVEAILNSRPLTPISSDPNDIIALTPGHFLIGESLTSLPELDLSSTSVPASARWRHIQKMRQDFWKRWYKEYLNELNIRHKWSHGEHQIKEGSIVILKEDNTPPMQWLLGRVTATFPGSDGIVRTVNVKTAKNEFKRNVRKLASLPIDTENVNTRLCD